MGLGAILGALQLGAAPLASVNEPTVTTFNPALVQYNVIINAKITVVPA